MKQKIGIWGLGIVGKSAIRYFSKQAMVALEVIDKRSPTPEEQCFLQEYGATFYHQNDIIPFLNRNDLILPSCGIDLNPYQTFAYKWLSELDIFYQECKKPIIAITGSVGKTTLTTHLSALLQSQGFNVFTGGNIGVGLLDCLEKANAADYIVLEVSSFQLERTQNFAPFLAIITNIYPNHLDRHGNLQAYTDAKLKILQGENTTALLPYSLKTSMVRYASQSSALTTNGKSSNRPTSFFSCENPYFDLDDFQACYFLHNLKVLKNYRTSQEIMYEFKHIPPQFYNENLLILAAALDLLKLPLTGFDTLFESKATLSHRLEKVATINGIDFYNDSKSTIGPSTLAAVQKLQGGPIILFLGGISKGVSRKDLVKELKNKVRYIICFGKEAWQLNEYCDAYSISSHVCKNLEDALAFLPKILQSSDQVLFSPAGASFDLYKDYQERGEHFKQLITILNVN